LAFRTLAEALGVNGRLDEDVALLRSAASTVVGVASRAALTAWLTRKAVGAGEEGSEGTLASIRDAVATAGREARFADASAGVVDLFELAAGVAVRS
jgi:hypothetical protein